MTKLLPAAAGNELRIHTPAIGNRAGRPSEGNTEDLPGLTDGKKTCEFSASERVAIAEAVERELGNRQGQRTDQLSEDLPEVANSGKTSEIAAKKAGFANRETYRKAATVVEIGAPELVVAMNKEESSMDAAEVISALAEAIRRLTEYRPVLDQHPLHLLGTRCDASTSTSEFQETAGPIRKACGGAQWSTTRPALSEIGCKLAAMLVAVLPVKGFDIRFVIFLSLDFMHCVAGLQHGLY